MAKIPDVTVTLHQVEFPENPPVILMGEIPGRIPIKMKMGEIHGD